MTYYGSQYRPMPNLNPATTPLAGTELMRVYQDGDERNTPISSLIVGTGASTSVATLAALKALTTRPLLVTMDGYYTAGDGGGGDFWWDAGSVTATADAIVVQCTSGSIGRYKRIWSGAVNVKWLGAIGDNSTDDTTAIQAAITYVANLPTGGAVYFPPGTYKISAALVIPLNKNVFLVGSGMSSSIIRQVTATENGVQFSRDDFLPGSGVVNLSLEAGAGALSTLFFGTGTSGTGIVVDGAGDAFTLNNVGIYNYTGGLELLGCFNTRHYNVAILFCSGIGLLVDKNGTGAGASNQLNGFKISNFGFTGDNSTSVGLRIRASGGEFLSTVDITSFNKGVVMDPRAGELVAYIAGSGRIAADGSTSDGWTFDGTLGQVGACYFSDLWAGFNGGNGVVVLGANVSGIYAAGLVRENAQHGIHLNAGGLSWLGGSINNNSRGNSNTYDGVNVAADVADWDVLCSFIGNNSSSSISHQRRGITIASGASNNFKVAGNTFAGNLTAPMSDGSTGSNIQIESNLPSANIVVNRTSGILPGAITSSSASLGIGYSTGAGGAVTQLTDKSTGVSLNAACGQITMNGATLNGDTTVSFVLTNSAIFATDVLILNHLSGGTAGAYALNAQCGVGSASINVRNITAGNLGEAIVISFVLVRGVIS